MIQGRIHSIETFGSVDGPGTRFIIFVQGCHMRCLYCHNVDTWKCGQGGQLKTADELLDQAERYRPYWGPEGGITVSGGEPLLQMEFLLDLFRKAKARGIGTCIDTAGQPNDNILDLFRYLSDSKKPIWVRQVLVPGWTDDPASLKRTRQFLDTLANIQRVEVLPYHNMGLYKWEELGIPNQLKDVKPPTREEVDKARAILRAI